MVNSRVVVIQEKIGHRNLESCRQVKPGEYLGGLGAARDGLLEVGGDKFALVGGQAPQAGVLQAGDVPDGIPPVMPLHLQVLVHLQPEQGKSGQEGRGERGGIPLDATAEHPSWHPAYR